jgi:anoctamin-10
MRLNTTIEKADVMEQVNYEAYDTFDDYLEIVLEFGFLVLFAECFPLAPIIILIVNNIEIRSDLFKLSTVFRRPDYIRKRNIGSWHLIFKILSVLSVFTNMLFTFTYSDGSFKNYIGDNMGAGQLLKFFFLEHFVIISIVVLKLCISTQSYWVSLFMARREYKQKNVKITNLITKKNSFINKAIN